MQPGSRRSAWLLDELGPEGLVITRHGKPIARVVPYGREPAELIGSLRDRVEVRGNLLSTGLRWDAASSPG